MNQIKETDILQKILWQREKQDEDQGRDLEEDRREDLFQERQIEKEEKSGWSDKCGGGFTRQPLKHKHQFENDKECNYYCFVHVRLRIKSFRFQCSNSF